MDKIRAVRERIMNPIRRAVDKIVRDPREIIWTITDFYHLGGYIMNTRWLTIRKPSFRWYAWRRPYTGPPGLRPRGNSAAYGHWPPFYFDWHAWLGPIRLYLGTLETYVNVNFPRLAVTLGIGRKWDSLDSGQWPYETIGRLGITVRPEGSAKYPYDTSWDSWMLTRHYIPGFEPGQEDEEGEIHFIPVTLRLSAPTIRRTKPHFRLPMVDLEVELPAVYTRLELIPWRHWYLPSPSLTIRGTPWPGHRVELGLNTLFTFAESSLFHFAWWEVQSRPNLRRRHYQFDLTYRDKRVRKEGERILRWRVTRPQPPVDEEEMPA